MNPFYMGFSAWRSRYDHTTSSVKKNFVRFLDAFLVMCAGDVLVCICIMFASTYPDDFHERMGQQH